MWGLILRYGGALLKPTVKYWRQIAFVAACVVMFFLIDSREKAINELSHTRDQVAVQQAQLAKVSADLKAAQELIQTNLAEREKLNYVIDQQSEQLRRIIASSKAASDWAATHLPPAIKQLLKRKACASSHCSAFGAATTHPVHPTIGKPKH